MTLRNAEQLRDAARYVPWIGYWWKLTHLTLRRCRIEEKKINLRWFVTLQDLAVLKGVAVEELAQVTTDNLAHCVKSTLPAFNTIRWIEFFKARN